MDDQSLTLFLTHEHASTSHIRGLIHKIQNSTSFYARTLTPGLFGTFHLGNDNFVLPDSVPYTVTAGLYVRDVFRE